MEIAQHVKFVQHPDVFPQQLLVPTAVEVRDPTRVVLRTETDHSVFDLQHGCGGRYRVITDPVYLMQFPGIFDRSAPVERCQFVDDVLEIGRYGTHAIFGRTGQSEQDAREFEALVCLRTHLRIAAVECEQRYEA